jgi:rubrerythrin
MSDSIQENLAKAFAAESKASVRNGAFALKALSDGHHALASLFRAIAESDSVHARRFLLLIRGKIGSTQENLQSALKSELEASEKQYPAMVEEAKDASLAIRKAFTQSMKSDSEHAGLLKTAMGEPSQKNETEFYVCQICGHISVNTLPENCPICHAVKNKFKKVG